MPHAFLFSGVDGLGKKMIALEFAKSIQCDKSDSFGRACGDCGPCKQTGNVGADFLFIGQPIDGESREIGISSIRNLKSFMSSKPLHARFKIAVIDNAENMTTEAQNALLKILEEPSGDKLFFLLSANHENLLKTILSRVCTMKFFPVSRKEADDMMDELSLSKNDSKKIKDILPVIGYRPGIIWEFSVSPEALNERIKAMEEFFKFADSNLNERFKYIEKISKKEDFNLAFILENWIAVMREALFKKIQTYDLIDSDKSLAEFVAKKDAKDIADLMRVAGEIYFLSRETNASQRLAFEMLAIAL